MDNIDITMTIFIVFFAFALGVFSSRAYWQVEMINAGCGYYDSKTAEFKIITVKKPLASLQSKR